jgi:hypothetical protein
MKDDRCSVYHEKPLTAHCLSHGGLSVRHTEGFKRRESSVATMALEDAQNLAPSHTVDLSNSM